MKTWIYRWGPAILFMAIIFAASSTPGSSLPEFGYWDLFAKKGSHMFGYALLAASYHHALSSARRSSKWQFALAWGLTILYAASDECHQIFTPGRTPSPVDVGIDAVGGILGLAVIPWIQCRIALNRKSA